MTEEQFNLTEEKLKQDYDLKRRSLAKEYAFSNNYIKIGDIIEDHYQIIKVRKIKFTISSSISKELPYCVYEGELLTKTLKVRKRGGIGSIHQPFIKEILFRQIEK